MKAPTPKNCPFCGEKPVIDPIDWQAEGDSWASVTCANDACQVQPSFRNYANIRAAAASGSKQQKKIAVREWNAMLAKHGWTFKAE